MGFSELFDSKKGQIVYDKRTICEVHRELYDLCVLHLHSKDLDLLNKLIKLLEEAYIMGIKMNSKLIEYKCGNDEWSEDNLNKEEIEKNRNKRIELIRMLDDQKKIIQEYESKE